MEGVIREENRPKEPTVCVECSSDAIEAGPFEPGGDGTVWRRVVCNACDNEWVEYFKFYDWEYI